MSRLKKGINLVNVPVSTMRLSVDWSMCFGANAKESNDFLFLFILNFFFNLDFIQIYSQ